MNPPARRLLKVFLVAGESSGDFLGAGLMRALRMARGDAVAFSGVGGPLMQAEGLSSLFPMSDIAVMGLGPVLRRLPTILSRLRLTIAAACREAPDVVVLIDSPDFTHRVGRKLRALAPGVATVAYVSPTVWAWRASRAPAMARWCDHLLAVLPFEPEAHRLLGGPPTTYVGHQLVERLADMRPAPGERAAIPGEAGPLRLVLLPGSRNSEVSRLLAPFGATIERLARLRGPLEVTLPVVPHVRPAIAAAVAGWSVPVRLVEGADAKYAAFRTADLALAASGTVTLELALAGVPMVVAYRLDWLASRIARRIRVAPELRELLPHRTPVLPDLITRRASVPVFIDAAATPEAMADALAALSRPGPARDAQLETFRALDAAMRLPAGETPGARAARVVLATAERRLGSAS